MSSTRESDTQDKTVPEWTAVSPPYTARDGDAPPPWPLAADPRTPDCKHDWNRGWGRKGERQRMCRHCERWIWDRAWWPEEGGMDR